MNSKRLLSLAVLLAGCMITSAQTTPGAADTNAVPAAPAVADAPIASASTNAAPVAEEAISSTTNAVAAVTVAVPVPDSGQVVVTTDPSVAATNAASTNLVVPSIIMDEVPLTDAIKNLARQAGLNYMLDPKVQYGGVGPDGRPNPQPTVSVRWENLTPDQALTAVLNCYNLQIIDDPKTKIARITIKDPAAPDPLLTKIIQLKYAYATNMVSYVQTVLQDHRSKVIADPRTSQIVVLSTEKEMSSVEEMVARLDAQTKQVLIEARILETSKNPSTAKGIDWSGTLGQQNFSFGNGKTLGTTTSTIGSTTAANTGTGSLPVGSQAPPYVGVNPVTLSTTYYAPAGSGLHDTTVITAEGTGATAGTTALQSLTTATGAGGIGLNTAKGFFPATAFLNADGVNAALSFLNSDLDTTVVSTPRAVTLDNETATLLVTRAYPIFKATAGTQGSPGGSEVTYTNLGTILEVTPRISANNNIALKVIPEVSSLAGSARKVVGGLVNEADIYDIRRIETQVLIPSGNTLVMGGLMSDDRSKGFTKVPGLGDLPLLGHAFRHETKSQSKKNLLIFITPTIVQGEDFQPTQTAFLKTKYEDKRASDFGAWDSGKPQDWSNLLGKKRKTTAGEDDMN